MNLNLFFENLTADIHLGNLLTEAVQVHGGYMHAMYNYNEADKLETIIQKANTPIVAALVFKGKKMQKMDEHYFYVYEWFDGKIVMQKKK